MSTSEVESGKMFNCTVAVDKASVATSQSSIACGIRFDGGWPLDFCPSTSDTFGGWDAQGNAVFHCVIPDTNISAKKVEAVGYDFQSECGPSTGATTEIKLKVTDTKEQPTSVDTQLDKVKTLLRALLGTDSPLNGGSYSNSAASYPNATYDAVGPACYTESGALPPMKAPNYAALGLPQPVTSGTNGVDALIKQITANARAVWTINELLSAEKTVLSKDPGLLQNPYLITAWLWFENGASAYPDIYEINCNDTDSLSQVSVMCNSTNFQIAGYQVSGHKTQFLSYYNKYFAASQLPGVLQKVIDNSTAASRPQWSYLNADQKKGLLKYLQGGSGVPNSLSINDISSGNDLLSDERKQFFTLILGKNPLMVVLLNSTTVNGLADSLKAGGTIYGYIGESQKQLISNMLQALYKYDSIINFVNTGLQVLKDINAALVVQRIQQQCTQAGNAGRVTANNSGCVDGTISSSLAVSKWKQSANDYFYLQCVGFVYGMEGAVGGKNMYCSGNAKDFLSTCPATGQYITIQNTGSTSTMKVGDAVVWTGGTWGHIAFVSKIYDSKTFQVAEANYDGAGSVRISNVTVDSPGLGGWLRSK